MKINFLLLSLCFIGNLQLMAQSQISGRVYDMNQTVLIGVDVRVKGSKIETITNPNGRFNLTVEEFPCTLVFKYDRYFVKEKYVLDEREFIQIQMKKIPRNSPPSSLGELNKGNPFSSSEPISVFTQEELLASGQTKLGEALHYTIGGFNSTQQYISDATAHFDPSDFRGLGSSRVLFLINGKRKNTSALIYINDTPGKGDAGVDVRSIPIAAIEQIEILSDGASARYGSDAIAGVINIVLKKENITTVTSHVGISSEGDGLKYGYDINTGLNIGESGYSNMTVSFIQEDETNRAGRPGEERIPGLDGLVNTREDSLWITQNPALGSRIGLPQTRSTNLVFNSMIPIQNNKGDYSKQQIDFYHFGSLNFRQGKTYALYRTPYWVADPDNIFHREDDPYEGFLPSFEVDVIDAFNVIGIKSKKQKWSYDLSYNYGSNKVDYTVDNTFNPRLGSNSPTTFSSGGYTFTNNIFNVELEYSTDLLEIDFGSEFRIENFKSRAGQFNSLEAISFPGISRENEVNKSRYNLGNFIDISFTPFDSLQLNAVIRHENYNDSGTNISWKLSGRYKLLNGNMVLRGAISTGFRAPSLHQNYLSIIQTLVSNNTVSNQGTFNYESPIIRELRIPDLKNEKSFNIATGLSYRANKQLDFSVNFYNININDRIVFSSSIRGDSSARLKEILDDFNITSFKFFTNAVNTNTRGLDIGVHYHKKYRSGLQYSINLQGTLYATSIIDRINSPIVLDGGDIAIFDRKEQSRILQSRPSSKLLLNGTIKKIRHTGGILISHFGRVKWSHQFDPEKDQTFSAKSLVNLYYSYRISRHLEMQFYLNNVFDTYSDPIDNKGEEATNLGGRFKYPWEVNQFGTLGRNGLVKFNLQF